MCSVLSQAKLKIEKGHQAIQASMQSEINDLELLLKQLRSTIGQNFSQFTSEFEQSHVSLETTISELRLLILSLESQLKSALVGQDSDAETLTSLRLRIVQLESELSTIQLREATHLTECKRVQQQQVTRIEELECQLADSLSRGSNQTNEFDDLQKQLKELKTVNIDLEEQLKKLQGQLARMASRGEKQGEDAEAEKVNFEIQMQEQSAQTAQLEDTMREFQGKCSETQAKLEVEQTKLAEVTKELVGVKEAAADAQQRLEQKLKNTEHSAQNAQSGNENLENELVQMGHELTAARWTAACALWQAHIGNQALLLMVQCVVQWQRSTAQAALDGALRSLSAQQAGSDSAMQKLAFRTLKRVIKRWLLVPQACCMRMWAKNKVQDENDMRKQTAGLQSKNHGLNLMRGIMQKWNNLAIFVTWSLWKKNYIEFLKKEYERRQLEDNDDLNTMGDWLQMVESNAEGAVGGLDNTLFVVGAVLRAQRSLRTVWRSVESWALSSTLDKLAGLANGQVSHKTGAAADKTGAGADGSDSSNTNGSGNGTGANGNGNGNENEVGDGSNDQTGGLNDRSGLGGTGEDRGKKDHPFGNSKHALLGRNVSRWWAQGCVNLAVGLVRDRWHRSLLLARWNSAAANSAGSARNLGSLLDG